MSGFNPYGNPPQYPPPQNPIYPQLYNPTNAPLPGQPATQPAQAYPYQPGFAYAYPTQAGMAPSGPGIAPTQPYPGQMAPGMAPSAPASAPAFSYAGYPNVTPQPGYGPAVEWIPSSPRDAATLSDRAVVAGYEGHDGSPLWVIRSHFRGDLIPGKLAAKHRGAYVPWGGNENSVDNFEVCCARPERIRWLESRGGAVPPGAAVAGHTAAGEPLYVGRAKHEGSLTPGKVTDTFRVGHAPGASVQVCCARPERIRWLESRGGAVPPGAAVAGHTAAGEPLYVGRAKHEGSLTPGKVTDTFRVGHAPGASVQVCCARPERIRWLESRGGAVPPGAAVAGHTAAGEPLYVGRAKHEGSLTPGKVTDTFRVGHAPGASVQVCCARPERIRWLESRGGAVPPGAAVAGHTAAGEPLYVGRAKHEGSLTPGKVTDTFRVGHAPGASVQVCCARPERIRWLESRGGAVPPGAAVAGHTAAGEPLYVGRAKHEGSLTPGKVTDTFRVGHAPGASVQVCCARPERIRWLESRGGAVPPGAAVAGHTAAGEPLYVGRAKHEGSLTPGKVTDTFRVGHAPGASVQVCCARPERIRWLESRGGAVPPGAAVAGHTAAGEPLYVGRAKHEGSLTPGKVTDTFRVGHAPGASVQVCCARPERIRWLESRGGAVPPGAAVAGHTAAGEPLYVGRAKHEGSLTPGKVTDTFRVGHAPGASVQVCCARPERIRWLESRGGAVPPGAAVAGHTAAGEPLYVGRAKHEGSLTPGKVTDTFRVGHAPGASVQVCCARPERIRWLESRGGAVPPGAAVAGHTAAGEPLYVGRAKHEGSLTPGKVTDTFRVGHAPGASVQVCCARPERIRWLESRGGAVPPGAAVAGHTAAGEPLYVGRAKHEGSLTPGKVTDTFRVGHAPGASVQVCCARPERIRWLESRGGAVPPGAAVAGHTAAGEPLYVGRAKHEGSLTPGKVQPSHKTMYISFGGKEIPHNSYEVLCTI